MNSPTMADVVPGTVEHLDRVSIFPVIKRDESGTILPTRCRLDVQVVPDVSAAAGYRVSAEALFQG